MLNVGEKMSKEEGNIFKFGLGFVSGIISGIVLGLILAPKSGEETRGEIASGASKLKDLTKDRIEGLREFGRNNASRFANTIQDKASKISTKLDELAKHGSDILIQDEVQ